MLRNMFTQFHTLWTENQFLSYTTVVKCEFYIILIAQFSFSK